MWFSNKHPALRLIWEQVALPTIVRRAEIDLLHSPHYTMPLSHPVPSVVTFHDMTFYLRPEMHTSVKRAFFPWMMKHSSKRADRIVTDSENTRRDLIRILGVAAEKVVTIHLGYLPIFRPIEDDGELEAIREKYALPEKFVLYVGAVEPRKNLPLLLKAFEKLAQRENSLHLVIAGGLGWLYEDVLTLIESMESRDRVIRVGHVPYTDLPAFYNLANVFVYPSVYEGFGLPPLESMACGTPVITSNISSMPEFVGEAGILIPPNDEGALLMALQLILRDDALHQKLSEEAPKQAAHFTWKHTAEKTLQVYNRVLSA